MNADQFSHGDEVLIPWGLDEVRGTVREIYGTPPRVHVVVELTPELSGSVVDDRTTVTLPFDAVKRVAPPPSRAGSPS
jgi:hypothetical protein